MPVNILTTAQRHQYGRFNGEPTPDQLTKYCLLDGEDKRMALARRPQVYQHLGFALQLMTLRFLGTFLEDPLDVPPRFLAFAAEQMNVETWPDLHLYGDAKHRDLRADHRSIIRNAYGYKVFEEPLEQWSLMRWLYARSWYSIENPVVLFDLATTRLTERKVLLPAATTLERMVAEVYEKASDRLYQRITQQLNNEQVKNLMGLLHVDLDPFVTNLEVYRRGVTRQSGPGFVDAALRYVRFQQIGVSDVDLKYLPIARLKIMAQHAASAKASRLAYLGSNRLVATLLAFARQYEVRAMDDALDLLQILLGLITTRAKRDEDKKRLASLAQLDEAALNLVSACQVVLSPQIAAQNIRIEVADRVAFEVLQSSIDLVLLLTKPKRGRYHEEMIERYNQLKVYFPTLLRTFHFQATPGGKTVKAQLDYLRSKQGDTQSSFADAPLKGIDKSWQKHVVSATGEVRREAYTVWTATRLRDTLRRHDLFMPKSERWGNTQGQLLHGDDWLRVKDGASRALDRSLSAPVELERLRKQVDESYKRVLANLPNNPYLEITPTGLVDLDKLDPQDTPEEIFLLRDDVDDRMPIIDFPDGLMEIEHITGFAKDFTPLNQRFSKDPELSLSICGALMISACNIHHNSVAREDMPALTTERLSFVRQNLIRPDTLTLANDRLIKHQNKIDLVQAWGNGEVASADGMRFVVPVQAANALPNKKYFGTGQGITYFSLTSDQFTGFSGMVVPGTLRDSMVVLAGLIENETSLNPIELMTDTASYSDIVFGLFWLLGYIFSPRLRDIVDTRFWRMDSNADYSKLNKLSRHIINETLILDQWEEIMRLAISLKLGRVYTFEVMQMLQGGQRASTLSRAVAELGRIIKTLYALKYIDEEPYRRRIHVQLNKGESRNALARRIFYGQRGELRQKYIEGQEMQLGALGFVCNAAILWNTIYMDAAIKQMRQTERQISVADLARLSPLGHKHINFEGRHTFALAEAVRRGELRALRIPKITDPVRR